MRSVKSSVRRTPRPAVAATAKPEERQRVELVLRCETSFGAVPLESILVMRVMKLSDIKRLQTKLTTAMAEYNDGV